MAQACVVGKEATDYTWGAWTGDATKEASQPASRESKRLLQNREAEATSAGSAVARHQDDPGRGKQDMSPEW